LTDEFSEKSWTKRNKLFRKLRDTGTVDRRPGSGRLRSARTEENVETVNDLVLVERTSSRPTILSVRYHRKRVFIGRLYPGLFVRICI